MERGAGVCPRASASAAPAKVHRGRVGDHAREELPRIGGAGEGKSMGDARVVFEVGDETRGAGLGI